MSRIDVKSEITGHVSRIEKMAGDAVAEDDDIVILESMKMEIPIVAPEAGTILEILVKEGDVVKDGSIIARIEA